MVSIKRKHFLDARKGLIISADEYHRLYIYGDDKAGTNNLWLMAKDEYEWSDWSYFPVVTIPNNEPPYKVVPPRKCINHNRNGFRG